MGHILTFKTIAGALAGAMMSCGVALASVDQHQYLFTGYQIMFEGYDGSLPTGRHLSTAPNTLQAGLLELEPGLFWRDGLERQQGCLAAALYFEARGENRLGQVAVGQVILNRVRAKAYPDTICKVVWQNAHKRNACQFSFTCDGKKDRPKNRKLWLEVQQLAERMLGAQNYVYYSKADHPQLDLDRLTKRATHYHATHVKPGWSRKFKLAKKIGGHIFYVSGRVAKTMPRGS